MINEKKVLCLIPARGGSKGVPGKNLVKVQGKSLLDWTVDCAKRSKYIDRIVLSSEDNTIIEAAKIAGCDIPFVRPKELASDFTGTMEVVLHALDNLVEKFDYIVLLQITSPLRNEHDIDTCLENCERSSVYNACVSLCRLEKSPDWIFTLSENNTIKKLIPDADFVTRRQDSEPVYYPNGAVYVADIEWLRGQVHFITAETLGHIMPLERSIDIDTPLDLIFLNAMLSADLNI